MTNEVLGRKMHCHSFSLAGVLSETNWKDFLAELTAAIDMNAAGSPAVWQYPLNGAGGTGATIVQPITDSFLIVDTWPDHKGAYLFVCSCRAFDHRTIKRVLKQWSLTVFGEVGHTLRIPTEQPVATLEMFSAP